ncbi:MAG: nucleotide exchange factor GrpE [Verrucomicrobia bacterium]|nr:nucleotide exchange factor GrpE [Verrucomicrobiota bacterium]
MNTSSEDSKRTGQTEPAPSGVSSEATGEPVFDDNPALMEPPNSENHFDSATAEVEGEAEAERAGLQKMVEELRAELEKYKDLALRSVADLDNYRKRVAREKEDAIRYANASFLERLIPVLDNFELGLQAAKASGGGSAVLDGMTMVHKQLQDFLASCGVETLDAQGQKFDPNLHEAIAQEENAEVEEGTVVRQVRKGFRLRDRLLRPANVVVARAATTDAATPVSETKAAATEQG